MDTSSPWKLQALRNGFKSRYATGYERFFSEHGIVAVAVAVAQDVAVAVAVGYGCNYGCGRGCGCD